MITKRHGDWVMISKQRGGWVGWTEREEGKSRRMKRIYMAREEKGGLPFLSFSLHPPFPLLVIGAYVTLQRQCVFH